MNKQEILVVAPQSWNDEQLGDLDCYCLSFRFVQEYPQDGFSAWQSEPRPNGELVDVAALCAPLQAGFSQHALNRLFSRAVLRLRPKAVVVVGLFGCTLDLLRVAELMGVPSVLVIQGSTDTIDIPDSPTKNWFIAAISQCRCLFSDSLERQATESPAFLADLAVSPVSELPSCLDELTQGQRPEYRYDYSLYDFCQRDHPLLVTMQQQDTRHFADCSKVLDLACGVGIFLDCLRQQGIDAVGVERDKRLVQYAQGMGLNVSEADVIGFLEHSVEEFDGIYCSHFIEHLPVEALQHLLDLAAQRLAPGGVLVLVFPDPESIRSQLLGFWRDPEHVRFYHPELVASMAATSELELEWSSYEDQPHVVAPFASAPPSIPEMTQLPALSLSDARESLMERLLRTIGLVPEKRLARLERRLAEWSARLQARSRDYIGAAEQLEQRTDALWQVNQTWNWNDNATIRLRKRPNSV